MRGSSPISLRAFPAIIFLLLLLNVDAATQSISDVVASNKIAASQYRNDFFGIAFDATDAKITAPSVVNVEGRRARLVDVISDPGDSQHEYTLSLLADSMQNYPQLESTEQYVRSVRHQFEREGLQTVTEETSLKISGVSFVGAIMKVAPADGPPHFRGMYTTRLKGYLLSLDITASSPEQLKEILAKRVSFKAAGSK